MDITNRSKLNVALSIVLIYMDWQKTLYPGLWCVLFIIIGLLIWIIKLVSLSDDPTFVYAYYGCAIAALVALCLLLVNVTKVITEGEPANPGMKK